MALRNKFLFGLRPRGLIRQTADGATVVTELESRVKRESRESRESRVRSCNRASCPWGPGARLKPAHGSTDCCVVNTEVLRYLRHGVTVRSIRVCHRFSPRAIMFLEPFQRFPQGSALRTRYFAQLADTLDPSAESLNRSSAVSSYTSLSRICWIARPPLCDPLCARQAAAGARPKPEHLTFPAATSPPARPCRGLRPTGSDGPVPAEPGGAKARSAGPARCSERRGACPARDGRLQAA